jgi:hypothetical protein
MMTTTAFLLLVIISTTTSAFAIIGLRNQNHAFDQSRPRANKLSHHDANQFRRREQVVQNAMSIRGGEISSSPDIKDKLEGAFKGAIHGTKKAKDSLDGEAQKGFPEVRNVLGVRSESSSSLNIFEGMKLDVVNFFKFLGSLWTELFSDTQLFQRQFFRWYNGLPGPIQTLLLFNIGVWTLWRFNTKDMMKHFTESQENLSQNRLWTYVTHAFSRYSLGHLIANMVVLVSIGSEVAEMVPTEQFYMITAASAVMSGTHHLSSVC